ncbi:hypothetical protein AAHA92_06951 [Salvia divinorum]|uniref:Myb/SANT-like domain-containing protein n=1 Tax=Salvia divinorum TaxID=28513 RepID=A0ABD1I8E0_SALDI
MPHYVPPQAAFFYKRPWTPELDRKLLSTVIRLKETNPWEGAIIPQVEITEASKIIAGEHDIQLTCDELSTLLEVLKARYNTFNEVLATSGVTWKINANLVVATEEVWSQILKRNTFAGAYYHHDEPNFSMLAMLFGLTNVKTEDDTKVIIVSNTTQVIRPAEDGTEVIVISDTTSVIHPTEDVTELVIISDTTQVLHNAKGVNPIFSPDVDEVNSPVVPSATRVRRGHGFSRPTFVL